MPAKDTDIEKTFNRVRKEQEKREAAEADSKTVKHLKKIEKK